MIPWHLRVTHSLARCLHNSSNNAVIRISKSNIYRFGDSNKAKPIFENVDWTVNEGESWAVVGSGSGGQKTALLQVFLPDSRICQGLSNTNQTQMLLGHLRIAPFPPAGLFPFLFDPSSGSWRDPLTCVSVVSFAHPPRTSGGAFYDYSARYGAVRDEDRVTLRESMSSETQSEDIQKHYSELVETLGLTNLLDLPLVALSNGQTRRARVLKALLSKPELLLLDEPLSKFALRIIE